jgi:hypothetical protein
MPKYSRRQRCDGKAGDAFNGQVEEFPIIPLRLAGSPCIAVKKNFFLFKTNPAEQTFRIALGFPHQAQSIEALFVQ